MISCDRLISVRLQLTTLLYLCASCIGFTGSIQAAEPPPAVVTPAAAAEPAPAAATSGNAPSEAHVSAQAPAEDAVVYTCPMHPEIIRNAPGNCPICGMKLVPKKPSNQSTP